MMHPPCRHCGEAPGSRPRGMCWRCYHTPAIVALYPSTQPRGAGLGAPSVLPCDPTAALPGTPAKVEVLEQRALARQPLFHPADARIDELARGQVLTIAVQKRRKSCSPTPVALAVLAALQAAGGPLNTQALQIRLGLTWKQVYFALYALRGRGLVVRLPGEQAYQPADLAEAGAA